MFSGVYLLQTLFFILLPLLVLLLVQRRRVSRRISLPPGLRGWPILGNALDIPSDYVFRKFTAMSKDHGDMMYMEVFGQPMLILSSFRRAHDLFHTRGSNYSDRPWSIMVNDLMGWNFSFGMMRYGEGWRRRRRILHNYIHRGTMDTHHPVQVQATQTLLRDLLNDPTNFFEHTRKHSGTIILKTMYGYHVKPGNDAMVRLADHTVELINECTKGGAYMVDMFPILRYIPSWMPGANFQKIAKYSKDLTTKMVNQPFEDVKERIANDTAAPCFSVKYLTDMSKRNDLPLDYELVVKEAAAVAYAAGSDTTVSSINTFILAMLLYPEIQKKAQAEIDSVIGHDRLPTFSDKADLPYLHSLLLETTRWRPVAPLGLSHTCINEDVYDGYRIPAGTIMIPNIRAILHDKTMYPEPERFNPDRFDMESDKDILQDPTDIAFGFGRRVCVGKHFALDTIWITMASILSTFNIEREVHENGHEIVPDATYTSGILSYPKPFKCKIVPRSTQSLDIICSDPV